jgi:YggT family protein
MSGSFFTDPIIFLIQTLFGLYILAVLLRFLLQQVRADFYNPLSQFLVKATNPPLKVMRRIIPGLGGIDLASLVLAWLLQSIEILLVILVAGHAVNLLAPLLWAIPELLNLVINIFFFAVIIQAVLSWFATGGHNPAIGLLYSLTAPVLRPAQRVLPPMSGFDLSPILVLIGLVLLKMLLVKPLRDLVDSPYAVTAFL